MSSQSKVPEEEAKPFPWAKLTMEEVSEHRKFDCPNYRECLLYVANKHWEGWTCFLCSKFDEKEIK